MSATAGDTNAAIDAVWRMESAKLIAGLMRIVADVGLAEELAGDALVAALEQWPQSGVPTKPGAWLMTVAKRRAIDRLRREKRFESKYQQLVSDFEMQQATPVGPREAVEDGFGDDLLRLIFIACHPVVGQDSRVALTLRLLGGLATEEIARAFLVPASTIAQRIVRAKRTLTEARVPFEVPSGPERTARLESVLEVIYLIFNEGYSATAGDDWTRPALCEDALRLGRILATLLPRESEVHGLVALMEIQASRVNARIGHFGEIVPLMNQDRGRWNYSHIRRGLSALQRAEAFASTLGAYALQAAIAACHARAPTPSDTDWERIVALYDALAQLTHSPVVELNRAVAVMMLYGPAAGLEIVDEIAKDPALANYHLLPAVRGDFLHRLGRQAEARLEFERAAELTRNAREREFLLRRATAVAPHSANGAVDP